MPPADTRRVASIRGARTARRFAFRPTRYDRVSRRRESARLVSPRAALPTVILIVEIRAPVARCFDLARSIDFHCDSMKHTGERAIAGVRSGLINEGETVTWRARHLGVRQSLTSRVTVMERPRLFIDEQVSGAFRSFRHEHRFEELGPDLTRLIDTFEFESPFGLLGRTANAVFITRYMRTLLSGHQRRLRETLESNGWQRFIPSARSE